MDDSFAGAPSAKDAARSKFRAASHRGRGRGRGGPGPQAGRQPASVEQHAAPLADNSWRYDGEVRGTDARGADARCALTEPDLTVGTILRPFQRLAADFLAAE